MTRDYDVLLVRVDVEKQRGRPACSRGIEGGREGAASRRLGRIFPFFIIASLLQGSYPLLFGRGEPVFSSDKGLFAQGVCMGSE